MNVTITIDEYDFQRIYLALYAHKREMFRDFDDNEDNYNYQQLKKLIDFFNSKAIRENIYLP